MGQMAENSSVNKSRLYGRNTSVIQFRELTLACPRDIASDNFVQPTLPRLLISDTRRVENQARKQAIFETD